VVTQLTRGGKWKEVEGQCCTRGSHVTTSIARAKHQQHQQQQQTTAATTTATATTTTTATSQIRTTRRTTFEDRVIGKRSTADALQR